MDHSYTADYDAPPSHYQPSSENLLSQQVPPPTYRHENVPTTPTQTFVYNNAKSQRNCCAVCCQIVFALCGCVFLLIGAYVFIMMGLSMAELPDSPIFDPSGNANATFNDWESSAQVTTISSYNAPISVTRTTYPNRPYRLEIETENISTQEVSSLRLCFDTSKTSEYVEGYAQLVVPYDLYEAEYAVKIPPCPSGGVSEVPGVSICSNVTLYVGVNTTSTAPPSSGQGFQLHVVLTDCDPTLEECTCNYLLLYPMALMIFIVALLGPALFLCCFCFCMTCCGTSCCVAGGCCCGCAGFTALVSKPSNRPEYQTLL